MQTAPFEPPVLESYALLDSGGGEKLERFGPVVLRRPDPQALWRPRLGRSAWDGAHLSFVRESDRGGRWQVGSDAPAEARFGRGERGPGWCVEEMGARLWIRPTPFKHVGLFPEQASNWRWVLSEHERLGEEPPRLLNLFGYSGAASVLAALAGYDVTHVDASKHARGWVNENLEASSVPKGRVRVIVDDALAFARREVRRGSRYQGILLDPPHYGRGPKGEKWEFETGIAPLVEACAQLLAERSFLILSTYAIGYSPLAFVNLFGELEGGSVEAGELTLREESGAQEDRPWRLLPCGFAVRWRR